MMLARPVLRDAGVRRCDELTLEAADTTAG
jgi:hypothetical protein